MQSLAVKYRPTTFADVCSQQSIIKILQRQLELGEVKNCYLMTGASGCGKTTVARIFAKAINKGLGEPIEIDGASNNGVDNVKEIIRSASERSIDGGKYKIYIIDECHALTNQAWQAFLKCIEETPEFTKFIFCTTDPQKIPDTILNRCMRFNFNRIAPDIIKQRLDTICSAEHFTNYDESTTYISKICHGGMRDAISLLDKCASYDTDLKIDNVLAALGNFSYDLFFKLLDALIEGNEAETLNLINTVYQSGSDLKLFIEQFLAFCLDVDKYAIFKSIAMTSIPSTFRETLDRAVAFDKASGYYSYVLNKLLTLKTQLKYDTDLKASVEVGLLTICRCQ